MRKKIESARLLDCHLNDSAEAVQSYREKIESLDIVQVFGIETVADLLDFSTPEALGKHVAHAFNTTRHDRRNQHMVELVARYVNPLVKQSQMSKDEQAEQQMLAVFAKQIKEGEMSELDVTLGAFVASGKCTKNEIAMGLVVAEQRRHYGLGYRGWVENTPTEE